MATEEIRARRAWAYENPRPEVQALVPRRARRILDLGCSSGALGAAIKERQEAEVVGVEIDSGYAATAAERLDRVLVGDLDQLALALPTELGRFDCLIAADVLEHLRDPWAVLATFARLLDTGGAAVVSLPNVRYWDTFRALAVRGTWPRHDEGIFDRTHLRWFTLKDARELLAQAGLEVVEVAPQYRLRPSNWRSGRQAERFARTPLAPFLVFQYVLRGVRPGS